MHVTFISVKYEGDYGDDEDHFFLDIKDSFFKRLYLLMRDTETQAGTQAEGDAGSMQGA